MADNSVPIIDPDSIRLADVVLEEQKIVSPFIERQFPALYREHGRELIELVKGYYTFLETQENQSIYNVRRMTQYRNIDSTLEDMILFFKNKFMNGLFIDKDARFIVKNILDLYRRKGSREGIELFFRMFFESDIDVYYPSFDIFKPSSSRWISGNFLQLYPISSETISDFDDLTNKKIYGDKTGADAFVDNVYFLTIDRAIIPILFISAIRGRFSAFDRIFTRNPNKSYGVVYGSLDKVIIDPDKTEKFSSGNEVGDFVDVLSSENGYNGKARVTSVTKQLNGEIVFKIENGGYGYTLASNTNLISETSVMISEQTLFVDNPNIEFEMEEKIEQVNSFGETVIGIVVGQNIESIGIIVDTSVVGYSANTHFFESGYDIETIDRDVNKTYEVSFASTFNDSSSFEVTSITDTENVEVITDIIEDFLGVQIDVLDYSSAIQAQAQMSGTIINGVEPNLTTPLNEAFVPTDFEIGVIDGISGINPGIDYENDVFILTKETFFSRFNLKDQIIRIGSTSGVSFFVGDKIEQEKTVIGFDGIPVQKTVKGEIMKIEGSNLYVRQLTFESFDNDLPIIKSNTAGIPVTIIALSRDQNSLQLGLNADISGSANFASGKILTVDVIGSGLGYRHNETVFLKNKTKEENLIADLAKFQGYRSEYDTLVETFGHEDVTDAISKRWDLDALAYTFTSWFLSSPAELIDEGMWVEDDAWIEILGDINQDGDFTIADATLMTLYKDNLNDATWRSNNAAAVDYIENTMFPYMEENYSLYYVYGNFSVIDYYRNVKRLDFLVAQNYDENIALIENELNRLEEDFDARGVASTRGQGTSEGRWSTFESHINQEKKIQDSFFYQDYSYEITTDIAPAIFESVFYELIHPAGMKMFSRFSKIDRINTPSRIVSIIEEIEE